MLAYKPNELTRVILDPDVMMETNASIDASDGSDNFYGEDEKDDDELPMIIDEGPTHKKRGHFDVPQRNPFGGFPYNSTNPVAIQSFKGLPAEVGYLTIETL
jgi:hypothetical protein